MLEVSNPISKPFATQPFFSMDKCIWFKISDEGLHFECCQIVDQLSFTLKFRLQGVQATCITLHSYETYVTLFFLSELLTLHSYDLYDLLDHKPNLLS